MPIMWWRIRVALVGSGRHEIRMKSPAIMPRIWTYEEDAGFLELAYAGLDDEGCLEYMEDY